jgi:hypothetical protein
MEVHNSGIVGFRSPTSNHLSFTAVVEFRHDVGFLVYEESIKLVYVRSVVLVRCSLLSEMFHKGLLHSKTGIFSHEISLKVEIFLT